MHGVLLQAWQHSSWPPLAYPVRLTFPWPALIDYFRFHFFPLLNRLSLSQVTMSPDTNLSLSYSANNDDGVLASYIRFNRIFVSGELNWENPTVAFSAKCEPRTRCRYLKAMARSKHVSVIVRSVSLSRLPCHDFAIRPIGISFGVWLPLLCQEKILSTIWLEARDLYASTLLPKRIISISIPDEYCESRARN